MGQKRALACWWGSGGSWRCDGGERCGTHGGKTRVLNSSTSSGTIVARSAARVHGHIISRNALSLSSKDGSVLYTCKFGGFGLLLLEVYHEVVSADVVPARVGDGNGRHRRSVAG